MQAAWRALTTNLDPDVLTFRTVDPDTACVAYRAGDEATWWIGMRQMLIAEHADTLDLLAATPIEWFQPGSALRINAAPTAFGPLDLEVDILADGNAMKIRINGASRNPPKRIRLHIRTKNAIDQVRSMEAGSFRIERSGRAIELPGNVETTTLVITLR